MNLTTKTIQGVGWSAISRGFRTSIQLIIITILARLLTPTDFGLLAMVAVFTNFVMIFSTVGLTDALVQRKEITEGHLSSSFWFNILVGVLLTLLLVAMASSIAQFYSEERLTLIITVLASTFFISSLGLIQNAIFTKNLEFKPLAIIEVLAVAISGATAVVLALSGFGVWSLVYQQIISSFVTVILLWNFSSWKPKFLFRWHLVKELLGFGLNLTGFNFVNYFSRNLDNLLIGKFLGSGPLGFYNLAYRILLFPLSNISSVIGRVMFPALSAIQDNKRKVRTVYIKATRCIAAVTFPLMIGLLVLAPQLIILVFGTQWERSIFLVQVLALVGLIQSIGTLNGNVYLSQGRTDLQFRIGTIFSIITAFFIIIGLRWDVEGVTVAYAIATFLLVYPGFIIPFRLIDLKFSYFIKQLSSIFFAAIGMGGVVFALRMFLVMTLEASILVTLLTSVIMGVISYAIFLFILDKSLYREVFYLLSQLKPSSSVAVKLE